MILHLQSVWTGVIHLPGLKCHPPESLHLETQPYIESWDTTEQKQQAVQSAACPHQMTGKGRSV